MNAFSLTFDILPSETKTGKQAYIINNEKKLTEIFEVYGYDRENMLAHRVNLGVLENGCCRKSYVRGTFLTGGAVTNPAKSYHLELVTAHYNVSRQTYSLLLEMGLSPKETARGGNYIVYFKQSSAIEDFLAMIGAPIAAMALMSTKIEKDVRNSVNRKVNCDTANVTKTVDAAAAQIEAIEKLMADGVMDSLSDKLKQTALLRMENPELSITELAEISTPPLTKSCLNHRLRKLVKLAG
jgi:DNA-binding protein WhiA